MGFWAGKDSQRYYIEGGVVLSRPGGEALPLDPLTLEPTGEKAPIAPVIEPAPVVEEKNVLKDFTDENRVDAFLKDGRNVKPLEHSKSCSSGGRGGRYTDGCPKCEFLKKGK